MTIRDMTLSDVDRIPAKASETDETLQMDEEAFRAFYERTARSLWLYLRRMTGDSQTADDLLQETYYRFLRARRSYESDAHRRNYVFRIATNLVHDGRRRAAIDRGHRLEADVHAGTQAGIDVSEQSARRADLASAMEHLKQRERDLLWLAYAQGCTHPEIAEALGLKAASVKLLLFRARRRLAKLLRPAANSLRAFRKTRP